MSAVDPWIGPRGSAAQRLLQVVRERGPLTRPQLAQLTGMSISGIRPLVGKLIEDGRLAERPAPPAPARGRPSTLLVPVLPDGVVLGVDFGHAHVAVAVADLAGQQVADARTDVDVDHHASQALAAAAELAGRVLRRAGRKRTDVRGVVAGVPAPVDEDGRIRSSTIVASWWELSVAAEVAAWLHVPAGIVSVENDAHLGALGELRSGTAAGCPDFVYVKASHGLGAGLVLGGALYRGGRGLAGEIGHAVVEPDGRLCRCGSRGCLETVVSVERVREQLRYVTGGTDGEPLSAAADHPAARRIVLDAGRALGRALADVCNLLDPRLVVLGGELAAAGEPLVAGVTESVGRYAQPAATDIEVLVAGLGERAQVVGATSLAAERARARAWST